MKKGQKAIPIELTERQRGVIGRVTEAINDFQERNNMRKPEVIWIGMREWSDLVADQQYVQFKAEGNIPIECVPGVYSMLAAVQKRMP